MDMLKLKKVLKDQEWNWFTSAHFVTRKEKYMIRNLMTILIATLFLNQCAGISTTDVGLAVVQELMDSDRSKITNINQCYDRKDKCIK